MEPPLRVGQAVPWLDIREYSLKKDFDCSRVFLEIGHHSMICARAQDVQRDSMGVAFSPSGPM